MARVSCFPCSVRVVHVRLLVDLSSSSPLYIDIVSQARGRQRCLKDVAK